MKRYLFLLLLVPLIAFSGSREAFDALMQLEDSSGRKVFSGDVTVLKTSLSDKPFDTSTWNNIEAVKAFIKDTKADLMGPGYMSMKDELLGLLEKEGIDFSARKNLAIAKSLAEVLVSLQAQDRLTQARWKDLISKVAFFLESSAENALYTEVLSRHSEPTGINVLEASRFVFGDVEESTIPNVLPLRLVSVQKRGEPEVPYCYWSANFGVGSSQRIIENILDKVPAECRLRNYIGDGGGKVPVRDISFCVVCQNLEGEEPFSLILEPWMFGHVGPYGSSQVGIFEPKDIGVLTETQERVYLVVNQKIRKDVSTVPADIVPGRTFIPLAFEETEKMQSFFSFAYGSPDDVHRIDRPVLTLHIVIKGEYRDEGIFDKALEIEDPDLVSLKNIIIATVGAFGIEGSTVTDSGEQLLSCFGMSAEGIEEDYDAIRVGDNSKNQQEYEIISSSDKKTKAGFFNFLKRLNPFSKNKTVSQNE